MEASSIVNVIGLLVEISGVLVLSCIDLKERSVLEAQTRLKKAHYAYLQNNDPGLEHHFLLRRNNPVDTQIVDSHDPRNFHTRFRVALALLAVGMLIQLAASFL